MMRIASFVSTLAIATISLASVAKAAPAYFSCQGTGTVVGERASTFEVTGFSFGLGRPASVASGFRANATLQPLIIETAGAHAFEIFFNAVSDGEHIGTCKLTIAAVGISPEAQPTVYTFANVIASQVRWIYNVGTTPTPSPVVEATFVYSDVSWPGAPSRPIR